MLTGKGQRGVDAGQRCVAPNNPRHSRVLVLSTQGTIRRFEDPSGAGW